MRHYLVAMVLLAAAVNQALAQSSADTVWVVVHHVAADKRDAYEHWMTSVWGETAKRIAAKDKEFQAAMATRQRLTPVRSEKDGSWTYLSVYHKFPAPGGKSGGLGAVFAAAGWPKAKVDAELAKMRSIIIRSEAEPMLQQWQH